MNKFSYIALAAAMFIGAVLASFLTKKQYKKELYAVREQLRKGYADSIKVSKDKIKKYEKIVLVQDSLDRLDSLTIAHLKEDVKNNNIKIQILRQEVKKLKPHEKANWLINRYSKPQP